MKPKENVSIGDVCEFMNGGTPAKSVSSYFEGVIPWITSADITSKEAGAARSYITEGAIRDSATNRVPKGTILLVTRTSVGKVAITSVPLCFSQDITAVIPDESKVHTPYMAEFLRFHEGHFKRMARGATIKGITRDVVADIDIPLPPLPEQRRIADILDRADALRAKRRAALARLDELTQAIFIEIFGDPVSNPKGWPISTIEHVCTLAIDCVNRTAPIVDSPTPYKMIRTTNIKDGKVNLSSVRYVTKETFIRWNRRATPQRGDVLLTREAPVGEAGIIKSDEHLFLGQRLMLYRPRLDLMTSEYLLASFRGKLLSTQFDRHGSGSTVKHLSLPTCRGLKLLLPPLKLQREYSSRVTSLEIIRCSQNAALDEINSLFSSLQDRAFRGAL